MNGTENREGCSVNMTEHTFWSATQTRQRDRIECPFSLGLVGKIKIRERKMLHKNAA